MNNQTIVGDSNTTFLVLRAVAVHDDADPPYTTAWRAEVSDPSSPLAGLYAFGDSFGEVRDALAAYAWTAVTAGELAGFGVGVADLAGIHVVITTCVTYDGAALAASGAA
jgi:hypothetical protein